MFLISRFSGKSDFYDWLTGVGPEKFVNECEVYTYGQILPLEINNVNDLIPYYPYLVVTGHGNVVHLSNESYVDVEERSILTMKLSSVQSYWRKCKRKHVELDQEKALRKIAWPGHKVEKYEAEIVRRVASDGDKAKIDGLHTPYADSMRKLLYEEMLRLGWPESNSYWWCFGWERYYEREGNRGGLENKTESGAE